MSYRCVGVCKCCLKTVISRCLKYLREEAKAPWDSSTASWAAENGHLHILEYLVERKYDKYDEVACAYAARERPLGLFEVLARNRQSAVELLGRTRQRTTNKPTRMFTIPPRQQLSSPTWLAIRTRNVIRLRGRRNTLALFYVFCSPFDGFFSNFTPFHTKRKADTPTHRKERS